MSIRTEWTTGRCESIRGTPHADRVGSLRFDQSAPDRVADELDAVAHPELGEDVRAVALDGLLAQHEVGGDLARRAGLGDQLDDLDLARRERVVRRRLAAAGAVDEVP